MLGAPACLLSAQLFFYFLLPQGPGYPASLIYRGKEQLRGSAFPISVHTYSLGPLRRDVLVLALFPKEQSARILTSMRLTEQ